MLAKEATDGENGIREAIQFRLGVAFRWLNHKAQRLRPGNGGGMEAEIEKELADARCGIRWSKADRFKSGVVFLV